MIGLAGDIKEISGRLYPVIDRPYLQFGQSLWRKGRLPDMMVELFSNFIRFNGCTHRFLQIVWYVLDEKSIISCRSGFTS